MKNVEIEQSGSQSTNYVEGINSNPVILKSRLKVTKGHWKRHHSMDHIWVRVIWRWILWWPWNMGQRSHKVIETGTIRKLGCGFLFAFHRNYGAILYRLRDIATYWLKIAKFLYPTCILAHRKAWPRHKTLPEIHVDFCRCINVIDWLIDGRQSARLLGRLPSTSRTQRWLTSIDRIFLI